jgi:LPXTG-motif cell wall-anchored protein
MVGSGGVLPATGTPDRIGAFSAFGAVLVFAGVALVLRRSRS